MTSYQRATKLAAAPIGAGLVITSASFFGQKTSTHSINKLSSSAINTLIRRTRPFSTRSNKQPLFPRPKNAIPKNPQKQRPLSTFDASLVTKEQTTLVQWYESHLTNNPVATKMVTGSFLWGLGDFVAQIIPTFIRSNNGTEDTNTKDDTPFVYDSTRTARAVVFGFAIHAPLSHVHFNFLEWMTVRGGFKGLGIPVFKTAMEQFVYWSWISNSLYHASMGAMQGLTYNQITDRISDVLMDTQKAQWVFWIPVQLLNFRFVPVRHQLNVVLTISVVWTALMSSWYPPEEEVGVFVDGVSTDAVEECALEEREAEGVLGISPK